MIPKTRDDAVMNANHRIASMRTTRTHFTNTKCTITLTTPETSNSMHICNPDSNSRKVTGQRITTISDQANHL